jgi:hypothetical protein
MIKNFCLGEVLILMRKWEFDFYMSSIVSHKKKFFYQLQSFLRDIPMLPLFKKGTSNNKKKCDKRHTKINFERLLVY